MVVFLPGLLFNQFLAVALARGFFCRWALHDPPYHGTPMGSSWGHLPQLLSLISCLFCDHKAMWVQDKVQVMPGGIGNVSFRESRWGAGESFGTVLTIPETAKTLRCTADDGT